LLSGTNGEEEQLMKELKEESNRIYNMAKKQLGDGFTYLEEYGAPKAKLDEVLENASYDLLIAGTRGRSLLASALFGSVAEHLLHHMKHPLLIVP
jgi:nucleotide-binding universal stress UspA family protein